MSRRPPDPASRRPELPVADLQAALQFYEERLGFQLLERGASAARLARDGAELRLRAEPPPVEPATCRLAVADPAGLRAEYVARGVLAEVRAQVPSPFAVVDQDGNELVFTAA